MSNEMVTAQENGRLSSYLEIPSVKQSISNVIGEDQRQQFVCSIVSAVNLNAALMECDNTSILTSALQGAALKLNPSPQLGQFYIIPFAGKASFQIGYKGILQLAMRSGSYRSIVSMSIKDGELVNWNPMTEEITVNIIEDDDLRESKKTIGYYAMFEYLNGFRKCMYWSKAKMESHANKYSQSYKSDKSFNKEKSFWSKGFDDMGLKTMLKQLIGKWGIMSIDLEQAFKADMAVITHEGKAIYVDNEPEQLVDESPKEKKETKAAKSIKEQIVLEEVDDI